MKKKDNIVPIVNPEVDAQKQFSSYVQSIAFNLTLSRRMIDCLQAVRDYGWPHFHQETKDKTDERRAFNIVVQNRCARGPKEFVTHNFVGHMGALKNRGLIYWNPKDFNDRKNGERTLFLSRAGDLTCELLVECGLMAAKQETKKQASK